MPWSWVWGRPESLLQEPPGGVASYPDRPQQKPPEHILATEEPLGILR